MANMPTSVSVAAHVRRSEDGRLMLLKQRDSGLWGPIAGHFEPEDGSLEVAIKREGGEEADLILKLVGLIGIYFRSDSERLRLGFVFLGEVVSGSFTPRDPEIAEIRWFNRAEFEELVAEGRIYKPEYNIPGTRDCFDGVLHPLSVLK